jgi:hypothetical protein
MNLRPTQDVNIVVRMQCDALSLALEAYQTAWLKAQAEGRPLPEPPRIPPGPVIRMDIVRLHIPCRSR